MNQLFYLLECHFFLNLSVQLGLNVSDTTLHIKEMHRKVIAGEKPLLDFSQKLQDLYNYYLQFLNIKY
jgi:hypothetical protein|tara:strand:+ start:170 stop:373 length:204 start_codon:yes stop_codon:yes gene_type:complete